MTQIGKRITDLPVNISPKLSDILVIVSSGVTEQIPVSGLTVLFSGGSGDSGLWTSGSTGGQSIRAKNISSTDATGNMAFAVGFNTLASGA